MTGKDKIVPEKEELTKEPKIADYFSEDYCGFQLKSLANKIKSKCLKIKKSNINSIIYHIMI